LAKDGLTVAASRVTTGNHPRYAELERKLMRYFGAADALLVPSGYLSDVVVGQALAGSFSHALIDTQAHPALEDAARFLDCPVLRFAHRDPADLNSAIRRCGPGARLILLTDGMFSRDGSVAPLADYLKLLPRDAWVLVDDAHGAGVLGRSGRGALEQAGVGRNRIIQTIALSKAFGAYGGAVLGTPALRRRILERSHSFAGSTPVPLPLVHAASAAVDLLKRDHGLRKRLLENASYVKGALLDAGWNLPDTPGPIVMLTMRPKQVAKLNHAFLAAGIYPPFLKYPGGPTGGYFRLVISSEHSSAQLDQLIRVLTNAKRRLAG
jgi:7-keto-8-aminopelargonate synthetase-like enzyme